MSDSAQVVVIGGGITGLTVAHGLAQRGIETRLLEAAPRPGGVMQTVRQDGFLLEQGPFTVMLRSSGFGELLSELALTPIEAPADAGSRRYVLRAGRLHRAPTSLGSALGTSLLSPRGRARILAGIVRSAARPGNADETVAQVAARRLGREAAEYLAGPAAMGVLGAEADELSFDACLPALAQADREQRSALGMMKSARRARQAAGEAGGAGAPNRTMVTFEGGLGALPAALAASLGDAVILGCRALRIERSPRGYCITHEQGEMQAEGVVIAAPSSMCAGLAVPLAPAAAEALREIRSSGLGVVHLGLPREAVDAELDGFGFLVPCGEAAAPVLGAIWASNIFESHAPPGRVLLRVMIAGGRWPAALGLAEEELVSQCLAVLRPLLGLRGAPTLAQVRCWPQRVPVYAPGHIGRIERIAEAVARAGRLWCAGAWTGGQGVNDRVAAGRRLAAEIAREFGAACDSESREEVMA